MTRHRAITTAALWALLYGCAYTPLTTGSLDCGAASSTASPTPASGPTAVRTTIPAPPTPTPHPVVPTSPTPTPYSGPVAALMAWGFPVDQDTTLPTGPTPVSTPTTWELAPNQADKATLQGNTLHALKPGGILIEGHAGDRVAYLFMAAYQPGISSEAVPPNTPLGNFNLNGARIINSSAEWDSFYKSLFSGGSGTSNSAMSPPPPPSTPPIDFSQHSLLLYASATDASTDGIYVASVTSDTVDLVIPNAIGEGWPPPPVPAGVRLLRLIPKVPASATVTIERMPSLTVPSATPFPEPSRPSTPQPVAGTP